MSKETTKTPVPQETAPVQTATPSKKKFSFSLAFFRNSNSEKAFADKVAPSKRELEARATKRREQRVKMQGGLKHQPGLALPVESEAEEQAVQPA